MTSQTNGDSEREWQLATHWGDKADEYGQAAQRMRIVAGRLRFELTALHDLFGPIRNLHTTGTWQGNAATLSRRRLDAHEDRHNSAVRAINGIADDLDTEASAADHQATQARQNETYYRQQATRIDVEAGAFDDVYI